MKRIYNKFKGYTLATATANIAFTMAESEREKLSVLRTGASVLMKSAKQRKTAAGKGVYMEVKINREIGITRKRCFLDCPFDSSFFLSAPVR